MIGVRWACFWCHSQSMTVFRVNCCTSLRDKMVMKSNIVLIIICFWSSVEKIVNSRSSRRFKTLVELRMSMRLSVLRAWDCARVAGRYRGLRLGYGLQGWWSLLMRSSIFLDGCLVFWGCGFKDMLEPCASAVIGRVAFSTVNAIRILILGSFRTVFSCVWFATWCPLPYPVKTVDFSTAHFPVPRLL